jgi:hypothetical protein
MLAGKLTMRFSRNSDFLRPSIPISRVSESWEYSKSSIFKLSSDGLVLMVVILEKTDVRREDSALERSLYDALRIKIIEQQEA